MPCQFRFVFAVRRSCAAGRFFSFAALVFLCAALFFLPKPGLASPAVDRLLSSMSVEDKVGQLMTVYFLGPNFSPELRYVISHCRIGGVIHYASAGNCESPSQVATLNAELQQAAAMTPRRIGLFVAIDQEGGPVVRLWRGVTVFPSSMAIAATRKPGNAFEAARITARELKALGFNVNYAPVADININPLNPVIGVRSFGEDPAQVSRFVSAAVAGYVREGLLCTPKHFPGHGDTDVDSHFGLPLVGHDAATLDQVDFAPFRAAFLAGSPAVMTAHVVTPALDSSPGLPATLSPRVLQDTLRRRLGFRGLVFSDSMTMGALSRHFEAGEAAVRAIKAGVDVLIMGADPGHTPAEQLPVWERLVAAASSGELPAGRLDSAVRAVLLAKERLGLLDAQRLQMPAPTLVSASGPATPRHKARAEAIARQSITCVQDLEDSLPLAASSTLLVRPRRERQDIDEQALEAFRAWPGLRVHETRQEPEPGEIREAVRLAGYSGAVVVLVRGASVNTAQQALVKALAAVSKGRFVIVSVGAPYDLALFKDYPCLLATYGEVPVTLKALGEALFGTIRCRGVSPVTLWAR